MLTSCKECGGPRHFYRRYKLDNGWVTKFCKDCVHQILGISAWMMHTPVVLGWDHKPWYECACKDHAPEHSTCP